MDDFTGGEVEGGQLHGAVQEILPRRLRITLHAIIVMVRLQPPHSS